jgi:hypothetical protein
MDPPSPETLDNFFASFEANLVPLYNKLRVRDRAEREECQWDCRVLNDILHAILAREFRSRLESVDSKMITIFLAAELEQNRLIEISYHMPNEELEYCFAVVGVYPEVFTITYLPDGDLNTTKSSPQEVADHLGEVASGFREEPVFGKTARGEIIFTLTSWHRKPMTAETINRCLER